MTASNLFFAWPKNPFLSFSIEEPLALEYGLKLKKVTFSGIGYLVETDKGNFLLQEADSGPEQAYFIYSAVEHLIRQGFKKVFRFCLTLAGFPFFISNDKTLYLCEYTEGREVNFTNLREVSEAAQSLANFHLVSGGFVPHSKSRVRMDFRKWPERFAKRAEDLLLFREKADSKGKKNSFDLLFLENVDYYYRQGVKAFELLQKTKYLQLVCEEERKQSFCHHDYTCSNFILTRNGVYLDFSMCRFDIRSFDLGNLLQRVAQENGWNSALAPVVIKSYEAVNRLKQEEISVIHALLTFPEQFWRLSSYVYGEEYSAEDQERCLKTLLLLRKDREKREVFLEEFLQMEIE